MRETKNQRIARLTNRLSKMGVSILDVPKLLRISNSLSKMAERYCNEPLTDEQNTRAIQREERLVMDAIALVAPADCRIYHQGDPRGAALYVLPGIAENPERPDDSYYSSDGVAVTID